MGLLLRPVGGEVWGKVERGKVWGRWEGGGGGGVGELRGEVGIGKVRIFYPSVEFVHDSALQRYLHIFTAANFARRARNYSC